MLNKLWKFLTFFRKNEDLIFQSEIIDATKQENYSDLKGNLIEAFSVLPIMVGGRLQVFVNQNYSLGEFSEFPVQKLNVLMILQLVEKLTPPDEYLGTMMVSDGFTSHAITPTKAVWEDSFRLYYSDPWGDSSFLEEGNNILGIAARRENENEFSISYSEYENVIVAYGIVKISDCLLNSDRGVR